jgi:hypothetical protein
MKAYVSGLVRLRALPECFHVNALSRTLDVVKPTALLYLHRWKARGWVAQAGPRSGIYFNLTLNPAAASEHRMRALLMQYPSATLVGESVLHAAAWTTQVPQDIHIAVEARRSYAQHYGIQIHPRPLAWFKRVKLLSPEQATFSTYGIRSLDPAWALADLYADSLAWHPDPDDLDLPYGSKRELARAQNAQPALRLISG